MAELVNPDRFEVTRKYSVALPKGEELSDFIKLYVAATSKDPTDEVAFWNNRDQLAAELTHVVDAKLVFELYSYNGNERGAITLSEDLFNEICAMVQPSVTEPAFQENASPRKEEVNFGEPGRVHSELGKHHLQHTLIRGAQIEEVILTLDGVGWTISAMDVVDYAGQPDENAGDAPFVRIVAQK